MTLKYYLKIKKEDGTTHALYPTRKTKISLNPSLGKMKSAYLKVTYGRKSLFNHGTYFSRKEL